MSSQADEGWYKILTDGIEVFLYVSPGAKKSELIGIHEGRLKIKIDSPAQEGKANRELIKFLSSISNLPISRFKLKKGKKSKIKTIIINCEPKEFLNKISL